MRIDLEEGTVVESLSFEGRGEPSNGQPMVLSCGGIYISERKIPSGLKNWQQIINLPGAELSAKIFGFTPGETDPVRSISRKESLN